MTAFSVMLEPLMQLQRHHKLVIAGTHDRALTAAAPPLASTPTRLTKDRGPSKEVPLTEHPSLTQGHAELAQHPRLGLGLDALRDQRRAALGREVTHPRDHCLASGIGIDVAHERDVELHEVGL